MLIFQLETYINIEKKSIRGHFFHLIPENKSNIS